MIRTQHPLKQGLKPPSAPVVVEPTSIRTQHPLKQGFTDIKEIIKPYTT